MNWLIAEGDLPDLVFDSKLNTRQIGQITTHVFHRQQRRVQIEESWERRRNLGSGGYGTVWLEACSSQAAAGSLRAVKEIQKPLGARDRETRRFIRELEAIAKFSHERYRDWFTRSYGWFENETSVFIAMEYCEWGDLQRYLKDPFPEHEARDISNQVLQAISFMAENRFSHRDLKPGNILVQQVQPSWWVKLADFGITKRVNETATTTVLVGTQAYMPPEALNMVDVDEGELPTSAADIWALGQIVFQMLTTTTVFQGNILGLVRYVDGIKPFPVEDLERRALSRECCSFSAALLASKPADRPHPDQALKHPWMRLPMQASAPPSARLSRLQSLGSEPPTAVHNMEPSAAWTTANVDDTDPMRTETPARPSPSPAADPRTPAAGPQNPPPFASEYSIPYHMRNAPPEASRNNFAGNGTGNKPMSQGTTPEPAPPPPGISAKDLFSEFFGGQRHAPPGGYTVPPPPPPGFEAAAKSAPRYHTRDKTSNYPNSQAANPAPAPPPPPPQGKAAEDLFAEFFGTPGAGPSGRASTPAAATQPETAANVISRPVAISLEEMFTGVDKAFKIKRKTANEDGKPRFEERIARFSIKPGLRAGSKIKFKGLGDLNDGVYGDVHFIVETKPHPLYTREKDDLVHTIQLNPWETSRGFVRTITTIDGKHIRLQRSRATILGSTDVYPGQGMPKSRAPGERGDLIIKYLVS